MATVWETVTGNSSLPVAPGNTFYDHLNNQVAGGVTRIVEGDPVTMDAENRFVSMDDENGAVFMEQMQTPINFDLEDDVELGNDQGFIT